LLVDASDPDNPSLTATDLTLASGVGTLTDNGNGTWTFTPAGNDDTSVTFSYKVTDGNSFVVNTAKLDLFHNINIPPITYTPLDPFNKETYTPTTVFKPFPQPVQSNINPGGLTSNNTNLVFSEPTVITDLNSYIEILIRQPEQFGNTNLGEKIGVEFDSDVIGNKRINYVLNDLPYSKYSNAVDNDDNQNDDQEFLEKLNRIRHQLGLDDSIKNLKQVEVQIMLGTTLVLTAGFVSFILRSGALLASFFSTVPLFSRFDPVSILRASKKENISVENNMTGVDDYTVVSESHTIIENANIGESEH
jgi:hypothetical protein